MDDSILMLVLKWSWAAIAPIVAAILALFTWIGRGMFSDIKDLKKSDADCKLDLANFKTEVAVKYAKEETVQLSLSRIHDRLDKIIDLIVKGP